MLDQTRRLLEAAKGGDPVLLALVLEAGPRALTPGSRLLIERDGARLGTLGDPGLDDLVSARAAAAFRDHSTETLYISDSGLRARHKITLDYRESASDSQNRKVVLWQCLSEHATAGATSIYIEVVEAKPVFVIVGGGHVGRAVAKLADFLDFHVAVIDDREDFADPALIPEADEVICADFEVALRDYPIDGNTSVVLVTRGHKQDELSLRCCLGRGAGYLGMIGSKRRTATVLEHLLEEGFDSAELGKIRTPIGLDIGAETPEEIALSILSEVIALRRGGTGMPMYHRPASLRTR